jgi:D-alanyl-D-alanine dipeptidase
MHFLLALSLSFCAPKSGPVLPADSLQLVVGLADAWDARTATLYRFERKRAGGKWKRVGKAWRANIGKNGLAAGRGLLEWCGPDEERKAESDKKSPAGVFRLGGMYGYGPGLKAAPRGKLKRINRTMACVSDPDSDSYNRIVDTATTERDWDWTRPLMRPDGIKSRTIVVGLNGAADPDGDPPVPGAGSCVLFHLARGHRPTVGCTSLKAAALDALIAWLKPKAEPLYLLMTKDQYAELAGLEDSGLPEIP